MPYLGEIKISGPDLEEDEAFALTDAVLAAIEAGWSAPRVVDEDASDPDATAGSVLDCRVLGYPGGAIVLVILEGGDLEQTVLAVAALARHLTTWTPRLLEYSIESVRVSPHERPYRGEDWLPPFEEEEPQKRWALAVFLDDELKSLATQHMLALAVRSLWHPTENTRPTSDADNVVASASEYPWSSELTTALGTLLIRAAQLESGIGTAADLVVQGAGSLELAGKLLEKARETGSRTSTDGWTEDRMRGHILLEQFMQEHHLQWSSATDDDESADRQLRDLLWAGIRALATMASSLSHLGGPWQLLNHLNDNANAVISGSSVVPVVTGWA